MSALITWIWLATLLYFVNGCNVMMGGLGTVNPSGVVNEPVGSSLRLECVLNSESKEVKPGYAEHLIWMKDGKELPKEQFKVIDNYTAELSLSNVTVADTGVYICNFRPNASSPRYVCHNKVNIGYPPLNVTDFSCLSRNWQYLLCTFTDPPNSLTPMYTLTLWRSQGVGSVCNLTKKFERLSRVQHLKCNITSDGTSNPPYQPTLAKYHFRLTAKNDLGTNSDLFTIDHFARVLPNEPENFVVINESSTSLRATWSRPSRMALFPPGFQYRMFYRSQWDSPGDTKIVLSEENYTLTGLQPYTNYTFKLQCRSAVATDEDLWSQFTKNITTRTLPDVPVRPPNVTAGSFQVRTSINSRVIHIFWQMIPDYQRNGRNFTYVVTATPAESSVKGYAIRPENQTSNYALFTKLNLDTSYLFTIYSANEVGHSDATYVSVESALDLPDVPERFTVIDFDHGLFELSWIAPKSKFQDVVTHYTLFWCNNVKPHPFTCTGNISWIIVDKSVAAHNLTLPDKQQYYQFAIAANTPTASSGMVWATCSVPYNGTLNKVKKISLTKTGSTTLKVQWKLDCSERIGIVKGFQVYYCESTGCNAPCSGEQKKKYSKGSHLEDLQLTNLQPFTYYKVTIAAITRAGEGEQSDALWEQTYESEPPYAGSNFAVKETTNDSITFTWNAPFPTHGLIDLYKIEYNGRIMEVHVDTGHRNYTATLHHLETFTNYTIYFQACVRESKCSKKSVPSVASTGLGTPGRMSRPQVTSTNGTHVLVTFENPAHPNGHLDYYNIMVKWQTKDGVNGSRVLNVTSTAYTMELHCDDSEQDPSAYNFAVQAVNVIDNEPVPGPYSDIQEYLCFLNEGMPVGVTVGIIGGAIVVTLLVVLIVYCSTRFKQKFRELQNIKIYLPRGLEPDNPKSPGDFTSFIPPQQKHNHVNSKDLFNHLNSHANGSPRSRNTSGDTRVSASSMDELLQNNGDNRTEVSADSGSGMGSVSSAKTTRSNLSSDSGNDVDSLPPTTPDMVFLENPMVTTAAVPNVPPTIMEKTPESSTPSPYSKFARYSNPPSQLNDDGYLPTTGRASTADDSGYVLPSTSEQPEEQSVLPYSQVGVAADIGYVNVPNETGDVQGLQNNLNTVVPLATAYSRVGLADATSREDMSSEQPLPGYSAVGLGSTAAPPRNAPANGYVTAAFAGDMYGADRANDAPPLLQVQPTAVSTPREKELPDNKRTSAALMDSPLPESYSRLSFHDPALDNGYVSLPGSEQQQSGLLPTMGKSVVKPDESSQKPSTSKSGYSPPGAIDSKSPMAMTKNGYVSLNVANDSDASSPTCSVPQDVMKSSQTSDEFGSPGPYSRVVSMSFDDSDSLPSPKDTKS